MSRRKQVAGRRRSPGSWPLQDVPVGNEIVEISIGRGAIVIGVAHQPYHSPTRRFGALHHTPLNTPASAAFLNW